MNYPSTTNYKKVVFNNVSIFFPDWHEYDHMKMLCDTFEIIIINNSDILKDCSFIYSELLYKGKLDIKNKNLKFNLYAPSWNKDFNMKSLQDAYLTNINFYLDLGDENLITGKGVYCDTSDIKYLRGKKRKIVNAINDYIGNTYRPFGHESTV